MSLYARLTRSRPVARTRVMPPPEPPLDCLVRDSEHHVAMTAARACAITGESAGWPEPYGPDTVVFGPYRRAHAEDADYGVTG